MTKIKTYSIKTPVIAEDKWIGSNGITGETKNFSASGIAEFILAGLSPETGGTLKITEIEIDTLDTDISTTVNAISPTYEVARYENVFFNIEDRIYLLKPTNITIGSGEDELANSEFISFPVSVGPTGATGATGNGIASIVLLSAVGLVKTYRITYTNSSTFDFTVTDGADGEDATTDNLQRVIDTSISLANSDNNSTIFVNNGVSNINITVPTGLVANFEVCIVQQGTGNISIVETTTTVNTPLGLVIKGQNDGVYLWKVGATENFQLLGPTKL